MPSKHTEIPVTPTAITLHCRDLLTCRVEMWRGGLGLAYLYPTLSFVGASLSKPCPVSTSRSSNRTCTFRASGSR
jgi:hypothetical protein